MGAYQPYTLNEVFERSKKELFTVVSTFAGGGGSSTGYRLAGGKVVVANEVDPIAAKTYGLNYPDTSLVNLDIRKITRKGGRKAVLDFFGEFGIGLGELDILDGSPPCTTFSGPVAYLCRSKCSFKLPFVQKRPDFSSPMLNADGAGYRSR